jgi:hypothetical protein
MQNRANIEGPMTAQTMLAFSHQRLKSRISWVSSFITICTMSLVSRQQKPSRRLGWQCRWSLIDKKKQVELKLVHHTILFWRQWHPLRSWV